MDKESIKEYLRNRRQFRRIRLLVKKSLEQAGVPKGKEVKFYFRGMKSCVGYGYKILEAGKGKANAELQIMLCGGAESKYNKLAHYLEGNGVIQELDFATNAVRIIQSKNCAI